MKNLLIIEKIMNQKQENMEKMASMVLLSYSIGLLSEAQLTTLD
jgi:hypothetical protein